MRDDEACEDVRRIAWQQIRDTGAAGLSLAAIGRELGLDDAELRRCYRTRDALLTDLILEAWQDLAAVLSDASRAVHRWTLQRRISAVGQAFRGWALDNSQRYLLLFGNPVPGYRAPRESFDAALPALQALLDVFHDAEDAPARGPAERAWQRHLDRDPLWTGTHPARGAALRGALLLWSRVHGVAGLEAAGMLRGMDLDPERMLEAELESLAASLEP